jgi:uncharacterized protein YcfJ
MDKSLVRGLVLGGVAVTAIGAAAGYTVMESRPAYAEVLSVEAVTKAVRTPRKNCWQESVSHQTPTSDPNQVTGTVIGAVAGGILGHQVGGGRGKTVATVAGAAAGGYAGNKIQEQMQAGDTYRTRETRCATTYHTEQKPDGYVVHYRLGDRQGIVHMDHNPGARIPVMNGELVLSQSGSRRS